MERLTSTQISEFNNPLAFARERSTRVGEVDLETRSSQDFRTANREASYRLVTGAAKRLATLKTNLETMLGLSQSIHSSQSNPLKRDEIYGKLRSLSAGFDQVVDSVRFDGNPIFGGNRLILEMGSGSRPLTLETSKLFTFGPKSLNLSSTSETAEVTVFETVDDVILNQNTDFTGVSLAGASFIEGSNSALELDNKSYKVKILFTGNNSAIEIRDTFGSLIERKEGIDLTGRGREFVDFDAGIQLQIDKNPPLEALDAIDYTFDEPTEVNASILYRRLDSHTLRNASDDATVADGASLLFNPSLGSAASGRLTVESPKLTPPSNNASALESGFYTMNIEYRGENSYIRLTDALGRIRGFQFGVNLTGESTTVNFDGGLSLTIKNDGYSGSGSLQVPVEYNRKPPAVEEFDFRKYTGQIEDALAVVDEELAKMEETALQIEEINIQRNPAANQSNATSLSLAAASSLNILSGGVNGPLSLSTGSTSQRLALAADQIFANTSSFATQANQSPGQVASLRQASASNILSAANL